MDTSQQIQGMQTRIDSLIHRLGEKEEQIMMITTQANNVIRDLDQKIVNLSAELEVEKLKAEKLEAGEAAKKAPEKLAPNQKSTPTEESATDATPKPGLKVAPAI